MRAVRVAVVGVMVGLTMVVACTAKKKPAPARIVADEDRIEWARDEPTFVVIRKSCRTLDVYRYGDRVRSYPAVFGQGGKERKLFEGDLRTPLGLYAIIGDRFHERWEHFFLLDYPNSADARRYHEAMAYGEIAGRGIGGAIGIHGTDKPWLNRERVDWTWGCISIDNDDVRELASWVYVGTPVLIED